MRKAFALVLIIFFISGCRTTSDFALNIDDLDRIPAPIIDREVFFDDPIYAGAQISPDGKYISFRKQLDGVMNIWVKGIDEPFENARAMTADTRRPITSYFWSRDSQFILFVQDRDGDENYHIYAVKPDDNPASGRQTPPARNLTDEEGVRAQIYAVPRQDPDYIIIGLNNRDPQVHDVYRLNLRTGNKELLIRNDYNVSNWVIDDAGNVRHAIRQTPDGGTEILEIGNQLNQIYKVNAEESVNIIRYHEDFKRIYIVTNKGDSDLTRLVLFDPETNKEYLIDKDPEAEVDFGGAIFSDATRELLATYYVGNRIRMYPKNEEFERDYNNLIHSLGDVRISINSRTSDESTWVVSASKDTDPGSVYIYDRSTGQPELLYRSRPDLPVEHLARMHPIRYTARDGLEIPAYLTLPKGESLENLPVIVYPHGGPWARDYWGYNPTVQFLANRGYAVFQPNFRGSTGYGKTFLNAGNKEWGTGAMQHDITDGVEFLIETGLADPDRIGIYGISYGGYASLAGLAFTPNLYAAGVSFVGPSNIITLLNSIPPYWEPIRTMFSLRVGDINDPEEREKLREQSPLYSADQIQAPLMVIQGANDPRVNQAESDQIVAALRDLGRDIEYIVAPDEGHGFIRRENQLAYIAAMERFLAEHLGGRYQESIPDDIRQRLEAIIVDIATVTVTATPALIEKSKTAPLPGAAGEKLIPSTLHYISMLESRGQKLEMDIIRTLSRDHYDGVPVWRLAEHAQLPMGEIIDTIDVRYDNLLPVRRTTLQGPLTLNLRYSPDKIEGDFSQGGQTSPISSTLSAPVYADGSGLHLAISSLPLSENYETTLRIFDVMSLDVVPMRLKVIDTETIVVPAGSFNTYKIEVTPLNNDSGMQTLWISNDDTRKVIRILAELPEDMGGGSIITELIR